MSYNLLIELDFKPEVFDEACRRFVVARDDVSAEEGCLLYLPQRALDGSPKLVLVEVWRDEAAYQGHMALQRTTDLIAQTDKWLGGDARVTLLKSELT